MSDPQQQQQPVDDDSPPPPKRRYKSYLKHASNSASIATSHPKTRGKGRRAALASAAVNRPPQPSGEKEDGKEEEEEEEKKEKEDEEYPDPIMLPPRVIKARPLQGLGCEVAVGSLTPTVKPAAYRFWSKHGEGKHPLYAIAFNFIDARYYNVFATVGGNRVTAYSCSPDGGLVVLQTYIDADKEESFYTLSWASNLDGTPLLVAAGKNGIIRVINCAAEKSFKSFVGHGNAINEIRTQTLKPSLIVVATKDESVRLWNVHTGICILIFAGTGGHRGEVLSVDFHPYDVTRLASSGMDNTVKIWSIKEFWPYVEKSFTWTDLPSKFPTKYVQFPLLVVVVHSEYVDCSRWLGDFMLTKSVENEILMWEPTYNDQRPGEGSVDVLQKYPVPECDNWFMKFSCDFHFNQLAIGSRDGKVYVWEVQTSPPVLVTRLTHPRCKSPIRMTAVSFDGSTILACCDDGKIYRWDRADNQKARK